MNTLTFRILDIFYSVSIFSHSHTFFTIESVTYDNFSNVFLTNISPRICEYFKEYYRRITFPQLQEVHMRYVTVIRNLREDADKTQQEIADFLGTSQTMYARYERGANEIPLHHVMRLAKYYNVSMDYLCGISALKRPYPVV